MSMGEKIKKIRKDNNVSQEVFAESIGVSKRTVIEWEHDRFQPQLENINQICKKYNIAVTYFIEENKLEEEKDVKDHFSNLIISYNDYKINTNQYYINTKKNRYFVLIIRIIILLISIPFIYFGLTESLLTGIILLIVAGILLFIFFKFPKFYYNKNAIKLVNERIEYYNTLKKDSECLLGCVFPIYYKANERFIMRYQDKEIINVDIKNIKYIQLYKDENIVNGFLNNRDFPFMGFQLRIYFNNGEYFLIKLLTRCTKYELMNAKISYYIAEELNRIKVIVKNDD